MCLAPWPVCLSLISSQALVRGRSKAAGSLALPLSQKRESGQRQRQPPPVGVLLAPWAGIRHLGPEEGPSGAPASLAQPEVSGRKALVWVLGSSHAQDMPVFPRRLQGPAQSVGEAVGRDSSRVSKQGAKPTWRRTFSWEDKIKVGSAGGRDRRTRLRVQGTLAFIHGGLRPCLPEN